MAALLMVTQFLCQPCFLGWTWGDTSGCPEILLALVERGKIRDHSTPGTALTWEHSFREMGVPLSPQSCSTQWEVAPRVCHLILCFYSSNPGLNSFPPHGPSQKALPSGTVPASSDCLSLWLIPETMRFGCLCLVWFCPHWDKLLFIL